MNIILYTKKIDFKIIAHITTSNFLATPTFFIFWVGWTDIIGRYIFDFCNYLPTAFPLKIPTLI